MSGPRPWPEVRAAFDRATALGLEERAAYLEELDRGDPELAHELRSLLDADSDEGGLLDQPVLDAIGTGPVDPDSGPRTGLRVGPYLVGPRVGRGGMGDVYLAGRAEGDFEQRVALKMIRRGLDSTDVTRRFHEERRILAGFEHAGIARLLDGGITDDGQAWFSMEYVEGTPITEYCAARSLEDRLRVFMEACDAVQHAHQRLVVHRDLKPSNILVTDDGVVKLLDFGIAKALDPDPQGSLDLTRGPGRPLTPRYAAPEQLRGETVAVGTDVYALGVILYEILAGAHPHADRTTPLELEEAVLSTTPRAPSSVAGHGAPRLGRMGPRLDKDLDRICLQALRKEPERRYPSVQTLREDVERFLEGRPVSATPDSRAYRLRKFVGRHRAGVTGTAAGVVILSLVTGAFMSRLAVERDRARLEAANTTEVVAFLEGLFEVSDPYVGTEREVTARQILDDGARRIDTELENQPDLQARMLNVVGNVYNGLGMGAEARDRLREALDLSTRLYGPGSLEVAENQIDLGTALVDAGQDRALADTLLRRGLETREELLGPGHPDVARARLELSVLRLTQGRFEEAEGLARTALDELRTTMGPTDADIGTALSHLALSLRRQDRLEEAERIGRQALEMRRATLDPAHPDVLVTMSNLALVLEQLGNYPEAEALLRERARVSAERLGPDHRASLVATNNLAYMLWRTGRYREAETIFRQVIDDARSDSLGVRSPNRTHLAIFLNNLAVAVVRRGAIDEAIRLQSEALAINREVLGERHPRIAADLANLASVHVEAGDFATAEALHRDALAMRLELLSSDHVQILESRTGLATVLRRQSRPEEAEALLGPAIEVLRRDGESLEQPQAVQALHELAFTRSQLRRPAEAEALLREVVEIRRRMLGDDHPQTAESLGDLGVLLSEQERYADAEGVLLEAHAIAGQRLARDDPLMLRITDDLRRLYIDWGRPEQAEQYGNRMAASP